MPIIIDLDDNFYVNINTATGKKSMELTTKIIKAIREVRKSNDWKSFIIGLKDNKTTTLKYGNYTKEI